MHILVLCKAACTISMIDQSVFNTKNFKVSVVIYSKFDMSIVYQTFTRRTVRLSKWGSGCIRFTLANAGFGTGRRELIKLLPSLQLFSKPQLLRTLVDSTITIC